MKVGMRPPDIPLIDKIEEIISEVKERGGAIPGGSSLSMRSMEGFVQIRNLDLRSINNDSILRVIEHDPSRGTFLIGGDGEADITTEISWYVLRAIPSVDVLLFVPKSNVEGNDDEIDEVGGPPRARSARIDMMLRTAAEIKESDEVIIFGMIVRALNSLSEIPQQDIFFKRNSHSKSQ
jgi:hypothetical protein